MAAIVELFPGKRQAVEHYCHEMNMVVKHSSVKYVGNQPMCGHSIFKIEKQEHGVNSWVGHNGEYATLIKFCPFCGKKLE